MASPPLPAAGQPARGHIGALDSLRGIAALVVVLHHVWLLGLSQPSASWAWRLLRYSPLRMILDGRAPVILFFVLSGFVLAHGLMRAPTGYPVFLARRVARIYLPFAAAMLLSATGYALFEPGSVRPLGAWFGAFWQSGHAPAAVARHLLMLGDRRDDLDPVVWSLVHELRISVLLPLLLLLGRHRFPALLTAALLLHWIGAPFGIDAGTGHACQAWWSCKPFWGATPAGSLMVSAYFIVFFVIGIGIALHRDELLRCMIGLPRWGYVAALGLSVVVLSGVLAGNDLCYGLGAAGLIVLVLGGDKLTWWLRRRSVLWLGAISYSLYLIHVPIFLVVVYGLDRVGASLLPTLLLPLLIALSLAAAWLFHLAVERPARDWGRRLAGRSSPIQVRDDRASARA